MSTTSEQNVDVLLVGGGIMSATLGMLFKQLQPTWNIHIYERLKENGAESSAAWNNAGTGHAAFCELNYTPEKADGSIDITKALNINEQFEVSKQFWSYLVEKGIVKDTEFINAVPHLSFVRGDKNATYLKKRFDALSKSPLFEGMEYTENHEKLREWIPLMMQNRSTSEKVAATKIDLGTDVNFGLLTNVLIDYLQQDNTTTVHTQHDVASVTRANDGKSWIVKVKDVQTGAVKHLKAKFVFIGAGGGALSLLTGTGIPEAKGYGGFPVSGQWLRCNNPAIVEQHFGKVYGLASVGAPPMSVPHLDTRVIDGKRELLFGPYAGFTTKFLKEGSYWDLPSSINGSNLFTMLQAGISNLPLTKYLITEVMKKPVDRLESLKEFYPDAKLEDWNLEIAGQRVQIIKKGPDGKGKLEFGTEIVSAADGTVAALLGASPGASTSVSAMLNLLNKCFPNEMKGSWDAKIKAMIPSYGEKLGDNPALLKEVRNKAKQYLGVQA